MIPVNELVQMPDGNDALILKFLIHDFAPLRHIIEYDQTTLPHQRQALLVAALISGLVGIDKSKIITPAF